jgi:hypothetical protein
VSEIVDIAEETKKHKDEWLLFEVTETTEIDMPVKGRLLAISKSRDGIEEAATKHSGRDLQTVFTGDLVPPGMVHVL